MLTKPIKVTVYPNGDTSPSRMRVVRLEPKRVTSMAVLKWELGQEVVGCGSGTCRVFDQQANEIESLRSLKDGQKLFLVLPGKLFVWPAFHVGYKVRDLTHWGRD